MKLEAGQLWRACDPEKLGFATTAELAALEAPLGQERAVRALEFGLGMGGKGFNLFVSGMPGTGRKSTVIELVKQKAANAPTPGDVVYVHNFAEPRRPQLLRLPRGRARELAQAMEGLLKSLQRELPKALESEEFDLKRRHHVEQFQQRRTARYNELERQVNSLEFALLRSPTGLGVAPMREGEILTPEKYAQLTTDERQRYEARGPEVEKLVARTVRDVQQMEKELGEVLSGLAEEMASEVIEAAKAPVREAFADQPQVLGYLDAVEADIKRSLDDFTPQENRLPAPLQGLIQQQSDFIRYQVNVLVDNSQTEGAPVVFEDNPTYQNLLGRIEHKAQLGALTTDFTMIKAGALLQANGGYLILHARDLLTSFYAWEALKRALRSRQVKLEELGSQFSLISTQTLEPDPVPLDVKVVLIGEPMLYYLLHAWDPEFPKLFKVKSDFEVTVDRTEESERLYARFIATACQRLELAPFTAEAVARVVEHGSRQASDQKKLALQLAKTEDLVQEAAHWAAQEGAAVVAPEHIERALAEQRYRVSSLEERLQELTLEGTLMLATEGQAVGQINGLSVYNAGDYLFGRPSRITAQVHPGRAGVLNIEREVKLSGPIHDKGVLILSGFLAGRFGPLIPLSMSASLTFEQSYGGVEGDSASSAELYALLSALAEAPLSQELAVTGSINQYGEIQPVGGVTEKVEGFFELCEARGLTGNQGVIIPQANASSLNLKREVRQAVEEGKFHLWAISSVDEGIELLTGLPAGKLTDTGEFEEGSLNALVLARLKRFGELLRAEGGDEEPGASPRRRPRKQDEDQA